MSTKRVSFLTINSLAALSKIRCSQCSSDFLRAFNSVKCLSTATERLDFQSPDASSFENSLERNQNVSAFCNDGQYPLDSQKNPDGRGTSPSEDFRESPKADFMRNPVLSNENIGGYGHNLADLQQGSNGFYQNSSGVYRGNFRSEYAGIRSPSFGHYQQNPGDINYGMVSSQASTTPNPFGPQSSLNENHVQNNWTYQQTRDDLSSWNSGMHQPSPSFSHYQQNPNVMPYQQNLDCVPNAMVTSQASTTLNTEGTSAEVSEASPNDATLEMLDGFCKEGNVKEAVQVLGSLEKQGVRVDLPRYLQLMQACGETKALQEAKAVHEHITKALSPLQVGTYNKMLEMYSKCGSINDAFDVFNKMPKRNLTSWDTMITWLAKNDLGEDALDLFTEFKKAGLKPDGKLFLAVFSACSVLGDINEGMLHFELMSKEYGIIPSMEHYVSVVNMLGSSGYLEEALEFIEEMPFEPSVDVWETLMNLCRVHGHLELGDRCAELVEQLDPSRLNEQSKAGLIPVKASDLAKEKEKKKLASNLLEVRSRVHEYRAGDTSHPDSDKIYAHLRRLREHMKEAGYVPETRFVLHDIDQEGKEEALLAHSERLAVVHGFLTTSARSPVRVIKNLRVCGDCHAAMKIISKIVGRELIMRDAKRFHHFKDGLCSCRDYW